MQGDKDGVMELEMGKLGDKKIFIFQEYNGINCIMSLAYLYNFVH